MTKLTIGMPVYNGAATLRAALDSLLAQTFTDFRIIISDNNSTDNTQDICEAYAARDLRVNYVRQAKSLGAQMNFRFVLFEAITPYFMWAAADDLWATQFAERNIAALQDDPSLVMSQSRVLFTVNGAPSHMAVGTFPLLEEPGINAVRFFENPADNSRYYGVFRTDALKTVFPTRSFFALDWLVSAATLLHGKHNELSEVLMIRDSSDPASYQRAVLTDHRFILWRIFPLLFMTRWLITHRSVRLSRPLLHRLWKANLYIHFRFGVLKSRKVAARYLETNSLVLALGLRRLPATTPTAPQSVPLETVTGPHLGPPSIPALTSTAWTCLTEMPAAPRLSVIILADTGLLDAYRALLTAQKLASGAPVEVILVIPAGAGYGSNTFLSLKGVIVAEVGGERTAGRLINAGLARATAANLLLVRSNAWYGAEILPALEEALARAPLVAPQILYADGMLAAAGGVISGNAELWRYGRLGHRAEPKYHFARSCDVACGALAMRREALQEPQPFDEAMQHFDVAVADLCLRERARLGPPLYWPWARIAGADDPWRELEPDTALSPPDFARDLARLQTRNSKTLSHFSQLEAEGRPSHDRTCQRRMLYVDAVTPRPDENAGSIEVESQLTLLNDFGYRVIFIPESNFLLDGQHTEALQKLGVDVRYHPFTTSVREVIEAEVSNGLFDVVVLCRAYIADRYMPIVRELVPAAKVIFYPVDLHFLREERQAKLSGDRRQITAAQISRLTELASVNSADSTLVHSTAERDLLARDAPGAKTHLLPLTRAVPATLTAPGPEGRRDIIFIGTYQHPPNADAAIFFAKEVWPLVRWRLPEARFLVVGSAVTPEVSALAGDGVEVVGFVQELGPVLDNMRVSVAPLRYGAGLKGKVATALQAGLPTVATSMAAEGMALEDGRDILLAETAQELADAVVRLYTDDELWRSLAANGFAFARGEFSFEANAKRIAALLAVLNVSTLKSEQILLEADLASGDQVFRPSKFWTELSAEHVAQLTDERLMGFKRTINNCYMQWLPGYFSDPRVKLPMAAFRDRPSMLPVEVATNAKADPDLANEVVGYAGFSPFSNPDYMQFYAFYTGLVWHLMTLHAGDDLYQRLEEPALGKPIRLAHKDQAISQDLAQSLLEYSQIRQLTGALPPTGQLMTYLELGAGYGRLAYVILNSRPCRYIIVDIPPTILVAKWYLSRIFPQRQTFGYRPFANFDEVRDELEAASIIFLSPNQLALLPDGFVDVSISISSLHEMSPAQSARYREMLEAKTASVIYFKQWIKWRNPADDIEVGVADYQIRAPWQLSLESVDLANHEFIELGWLRG